MSSLLSNRNKAGTFIPTSAVQQRDVLLGRGAFCAGHVGTIAFKAVIESRLDAYITASSRKEKTLLTLEVVTSIEHAGGRFLQENKSQIAAVRIEPASSSQRPPEHWYEISRQTARIKVRDTLRDCLKNFKKQGLSSVLLNRIGLSGLFGKSATFTEIVDHVAKSSNIRKYICDRNDLIDERKRQRRACCETKPVATDTASVSAVVSPPTTTTGMLDTTSTTSQEQQTPNSSQQHTVPSETIVAPNGRTDNPTPNSSERDSSNRQPAQITNVPPPTAAAAGFREIPALLPTSMELLSAPDDNVCPPERAAQALNLAGSSMNLVRESVPLTELHRSSSSASYRTNTDVLLETLIRDDDDDWYRTDTVYPPLLLPPMQQRLSSSISSSNTTNPTNVYEENLSQVLIADSALQGGGGYQQHEEMNTDEYTEEFLMEIQSSSSSDNQDVPSLVSNSRELTFSELLETAIQLSENTEGTVLDSTTNKGMCRSIAEFRSDGNCDRRNRFRGAVSADELPPPFLLV